MSSLPAPTTLMDVESASLAATPPIVLPSAAGPLDNDTAAKVLDALSCGAPVLVDTSGLWANQLDGERAVAAILLEHTHFEVLCRCSQQMDGGSDLDVRSQTSTATLVALRWPNDQRAFCCFVENSFVVNCPKSYFGVHLYVINDKKKPQAVAMLKMMVFRDSGYRAQLFAERTVAGMKSLRQQLRTVSVPSKPYGCFGKLSDQQLTTLLIGAAEAKADLVPRDDAAKLRERLLYHARILKDPPGGSFGGHGQKNPAKSIGNGVALHLWEPLAMPLAAAASGAAAATNGGDACDGGAAGAAGSTAPSSTAAGKKTVGSHQNKMTTSPATLQLLQALAAFSPRDASQAPRKPTFKMAKLANPDASGSDRAAGWGGDCGLFHELGVEVFLKVLEHCPLHSRLVLTEFTNKSFRMMRLEPELFSTLRLHHCDSVKLTSQLKCTVRDKDAIFCPASHFANLLHAKQHVVRHLYFTGGDTPLTAIKASIKVVGARLASLSLQGESLINSTTLKEIGKHCTNLTFLDLNCGKYLGDNEKVLIDEEALIEAVRGMKLLSTLRLPPFQLFSTFIGDWRWVKGWISFNHPLVEEERLMEEIDVSRHDFADGTEGDLTVPHSYVTRATLLRKLQSVLPRRCKLTNNGAWGGSSCLSRGWGTPAVKDSIEWSIFGANSYKQLNSDLQVSGSDGSIIVKGLVKTVYLQCGDPEELRADGLETAQRFYTTLADWQAANPEPKEAPKPLGAIIET
jgi:hypothetical protein